MRLAMPAVVVALVVGVVGVHAQADTPALFKDGLLPKIAVNSVEVGGGEVLLEVTVDATGAVTAIKPLRETATFTERMLAAVRAWRFTPAEVEIPAARRKPEGPAAETVESKVLVAGIFRRPAVIGVTLGEPIKETAVASTAIPFPTSVVTPTYPPGTMSPGVVLVQVGVDARGGVSDAKVLVSAPGFDSAALTTARQWRFRPAKAEGATTASVAYIVFGFPVPKG